MLETAFPEGQADQANQVVQESLAGRDSEPALVFAHLGEVSLPVLGSLRQLLVEGRG